MKRYLIALATILLAATATVTPTGAIAMNKGDLISGK